MQHKRPSFLCWLPADSSLTANLPAWCPGWRLGWSALGSLDWKMVDWLVTGWTVSDSSLALRKQALTAPRNYLPALLCSASETQTRVVLSQHASIKISFGNLMTHQRLATSRSFIWKRSKLICFIWTKHTPQCCVRAYPDVKNELCSPKLHSYPLIITHI